jgi:hypothetical protein
MAGALRELEESYLIAELGFAISAPLRDYAARQLLQAQTDLKA